MASELVEVLTFAILNGESGGHRMCGFRRIAGDCPGRNDIQLRTSHSAVTPVLAAAARSSKSLSPARRCA